LQILGEDLDCVATFWLVRISVAAQIDLVEMEVAGQGINYRPPRTAPAANTVE
jgi:hypothetical protein